MMSLSNTTLDSLEKILDVADKRLAEGKIGSAISYYSLVISNFRGQYYAYESHIRRAEAYRLIRDFDMAIRDCDFILYAYKSPVSALRIKGRALFDKKRYQEAVKVFDLILARCYDEESLFYREFAEGFADWSGVDSPGQRAPCPNKAQTNPRYSLAVATHLATYFPSKATMYEPVIEAQDESSISSPNLSESTNTLSDLSDGSESPVLSDTRLDGLDSELNYQGSLKIERLSKQRWSSILSTKIDAIKVNLGLVYHHPKKVSCQV